MAAWSGAVGTRGMSLPLLKYDMGIAPFGVSGKKPAMLKAQKILWQESTLLLREVGKSATKEVRTNSALKRHISFEMPAPGGYFFFRVVLLLIGCLDQAVGLRNARTDASRGT
jgi:hypothetical protein